MTMTPVQLKTAVLVPLSLAMMMSFGQAQTGNVPAPAQRTDPPPAAPSQVAPAPQQQAAQAPRPKMVYLGAFDAGQPGVGIYKVYDPSDRVLCYILMPEVASRRVVGQAFIYDGNTIGSLSCVTIDTKTKTSDDAESKNSKQKK